MFCPAPVLAFLDVGGPEMLLIFVLILVLFGGKRMPELARNLGKSLRDFKRAREGVEEQIKRALDEDPAPAKRPKKLRKPKPEPATTTPEDTGVYDDAAKAAGAAATTAASATDPADPAPSDEPESQPDENEDDYDVDPYEDEYIGGTDESDTGAHGSEESQTGEAESAPEEPAADEPEKKKDDTDASDGGGI